MKPTPPLRFRDDPRAPSVVRDDLARAADRSSTPFDAVRGLTALETAIRQAGPVASPSPSAAAAGATPTLAGAIATGTICGILAVGAAGLVSVLRDRRAAGSSALTTSTAPPAEQAVALPAPLPAPAEPPPAPPATLHLPPQGGRVPIVDPAPVASASELQLEMDLLGRLRALEASDPRQALALAEAGRRRFSPGFFVQEREVLAISALARLGLRSEARTRARAFLAAYPTSHFAERLHQLTGE
jgi:hypothetical protein